MIDFCKSVINNIEIELPQRFSISEISNDLIPFRCKKGICGLCCVKVIAGKENISIPTEDEIAFLSRLKVDDDVRLACQLNIDGPVNLQLCAKHVSKTSTK